MATDHPEVEIPCPNDCGYRCKNMEMEKHVNEECEKQVRQCRFPGCSFKGIQVELDEHSNRELKLHLECVLGEVQKLSTKGAEGGGRGEGITDQTTFEQDLAKVEADVQNLVETTKCLETSVSKLQEEHKDSSLLVQTLRVTSYDGTFIWKIPEIKRRQEEAKSGKTVSLYSAPFYTSRYGYKMCLRLYLDGDGSGKGTHLSFFLTLMRGEYDALLPWPFRQTISMVLLDQTRQKNIVQSFRPDPDSSSFKKPVSNMSVASGCPQFAPLSILENPSYVKDDTMFLQCRVDCSGLEKVYL